MDDLGKAYAYAKKCATDRSGKTPHYVKLQAKSWIKIADGKDPDAYVDMDQYHKICRILKIMNHPDLHCPIYDGMEDYAWFLIVAVMCTMCKGTVSTRQRSSRLHERISRHLHQRRSSSS